jgi:hypothetical protein
MFHGIRRTAIAAAAVLTLGIGAAVWATSSASAAPAATPACVSTNLAVWVNAATPNGAAGTIYYALELTNIGSKACTLDGYPGVAAIGANNKQLGDDAKANPLFKAKTVTLAPGATAHSDMGWSDGEVYTSGCKPATASYIKVVAPKQKGSSTGFFDLLGCTLKNHPYLFVTVIRPGPNQDN